LEQKKLLGLLESYGVIPVVAIESLEHAIPLADALIEGGLPVAEITFRTQSAADVIKTLKKERPELLVGAGTILSVENLIKAQEYGASFGVAPGFNPEIVGKAVALGFPFFPGVMTPSDVEKGLSVGIKILKFFPAEASGGLSMLKALSAPYAHLGVRFIPTGGININNLEGYLISNQVLAVGGTWIAKKDVIASRQWDRIKENALAVGKVVSQIRGKV
jgi:2-dehydro-3-deoxyphosphogluconate aldolase/(4S)-4-hydroxy-2-oxoglutarate aldolase